MVVNQTVAFNQAVAVSQTVAVNCGHMERMEDDRDARQSMKWVPENMKRKWGRPRLKWIQNIKNELEHIGLSIQDVENTSGDRTLWRNWVASCVDDTYRMKEEDERISE